jgi:hypothetical protein
MSKAIEMSCSTVEQDIQNLDELQRRHGSLPRGRQGLHWRLMLPIMGAPQGIPTMRGKAVATNGILVAILSGGRLVTGHLATFLPERQEDYVAVEKQRNRKSNLSFLEAYL